ncbi:unnamed protein product [Protopolystoma xenopodis]|uniref:Uncharacterized protein n=1 Tax=Protopolystoma xenopodis TaxID=117903 RepID=A0A448X8W7_9PLAT|nr:unnamed protein product [Protopolystoma xenopodis]
MQFAEDVQGYLDWIGAAEDISDDEDNGIASTDKERREYNLPYPQFFCNNNAS